jgi:hypothetical protein
VLWLAAMVWLGVVLVRLKAAGPEALRVDAPVARP